MVCGVFQSHTATDGSCTIDTAHVSSSLHVALSRLQFWTYFGHMALNLFLGLHIRALVGSCLPQTPRHYPHCHSSMDAIGLHAKLLEEPSFPPSPPSRSSLLRAVRNQQPLISAMARAAHHSRAGEAPGPNGASSCPAPGSQDRGLEGPSRAIGLARRCNSRLEMTTRLSANETSARARQQQVEFRLKGLF